jgi:hypothetical protein
LAGPEEGWPRAFLSRGGLADGVRRPENQRAGRWPWKPPVASRTTCQLVRQVSPDGHEIEPIEVRRQDEQEIADAISERVGEPACVGNRHARKLEQIDLQQTVVVGDQLDLLDAAQESVGGDAGIARRPDRSLIVVVSEPAEKRGDPVRIAQDLDVLCAEFKIVLPRNGSTPSCVFAALWAMTAKKCERVRRGP